MKEERDRWGWWQDALKGKPGPITDEPEQGYYRVRRSGKQWEPVRIFFDAPTDKWWAIRNGKWVDDVHHLWSYACRNAIPAEAYEKALAGGGWDDEPPPPVGDNSGDMDPFEAIRIELAGEIEQAAEFAKHEIKTQADADKAGIWAKRLAEIARRADGLRVVEKEPHLAASRAVDDKWREPIADARDWAARLKKHVEPFLIAQKRAEEARARAAALEAAELQRQAEAAVEASRLTPEEAENAERASELIRKAKEAKELAQVQNASAGRTSARVSLRTYKVANIIDFDACYAALKSHPEMRQFVQKLADRAVVAEVPLAGVELQIVEKVV